MAPLDYKSSLVRYRRYLQASRNHPMWRASLYLTLSLALIIVLVVAALRPTLVTIASLVGEIKQQRVVSQKLNEKIAAISRAQQELAQVSSRLLVLDEAIPLEVRIGQWDQTVQAIASEYGVLLQDLSISDIVIADSASTGGQMKFNLTASGPFINLKSFLQIFEGTRRLILISEVDVSRLSAGEDQLTLSISGTLANYYPK